MANIKEPVNTQPMVCVSNQVPNGQGVSYFCVLRRALLRCKQAATGMLKIVQSVLMESVVGVLAYATASAGVGFVRR
jgi:hypothetical protein